MNPVIKVEELRKAYGSTVAVDGVSFEVMRGEIFGVVGPNGAGKTTAVECVSGMRKPDGGEIEVLGLDPARHADALRRTIGIQLQQAALPDRLKVWEALDLYSSFYDKPADWRKLMERWGLSEKKNAAFSDLSGGQKQRLFVALALLNDPEVVFLDELTSGLDPQARRAGWNGFAVAVLLGVLALSVAVSSRTSDGSSEEAKGGPRSPGRGLGDRDTPTWERRSPPSIRRGKKPKT